MTKPRRFWSSRKGQGEGLAWIKAHVAYQGDDCLMWPLSRGRGYGHVSVNGRVLKASRVMCELVNGPPPTPDHEAAHSCGNGHEGCVTPKHLSWKTRAGNQRDRRAHGTQAAILPGATTRKLTAENVAEIRSLAGLLTNTELAARFGVTRSTIRQILLRKTWVNGRPGKGGFADGDPRNPFHGDNRISSR